MISNRHLYLTLLQKLLGEVDGAEAMQILNSGQIINVLSGEYLFKQGELDNTLYITLKGRVRSVLEDGSKRTILGDIGPGKTVGEFAIFTGEPRSSSVIAIRESVLLKIEKTVYNSISSKFPDFANAVAKLVIERLRSNAKLGQVQPAPKNIVLINLQPQNDISDWLGDVKKQIINMGVDVSVYNHLSALQKDWDALLDEVDNNIGVNILVCDDRDIAWAKQCLMYADLLVVASDFNADTSLCKIENELSVYSTNLLSKEKYLVLLHPENADQPKQTKRWLEQRKPTLHLHIRRGNKKDLARFCRIVLKQAVGLVLGGGGAKGFAHAGVARALSEAGIDVDFVGGTSAGALMAAGLSLVDFDFDKTDELCKNGSLKKPTSNDYTLPFLSLMTGKKMRSILQESLQDLDMEDLWINTFFVSTNYSAATICVHEFGLARRNLEASLAIPGVFPPVIINGDLHVDGGVMDNVPIEAMYKKPVSQVIAISVSGYAYEPLSIAEVPSPKSILWSKLGRKKLEIPSLATLIFNSILLNSRQRQDAFKDKASLFIDLDMQDIGLLEWAKWQQIIQSGYHQTKQKLQQAKAENKIFETSTPNR